MHFAEEAMMNQNHSFEHSILQIEHAFLSFLSPCSGDMNIKWQLLNFKIYIILPATLNDESIIRNLNDHIIS